MARVMLHATAQPRNIDPGWKQGWCVDIEDEALRDAIWNAPRFDDRITLDLLWDHFECPSRKVSDFPGRKALDRALDLATEDFFREVGLKWLAPVLAQQLLDRSSRERLGDLSREQMKAILAYQSHAAPEQIGALPDVTAFGTEGLACFQAWMTDLPEQVSARVKLTFPPLNPAKLEPQDLRAAFFARLLDETTKSGGSKA